MWSHLRGHVLFGGNNPRANKAARKNARLERAPNIVVFPIKNPGKTG